MGPHPAEARGPRSPQKRHQYGFQQIVSGMGYEYTIRSQPPAFFPEKGMTKMPRRPFNTLLWGPGFNRTGGKGFYRKGNIQGTAQRPRRLFIGGADFGGTYAVVYMDTMDAERKLFP
jgi:hypothetical protein